MNKFVNQLNLCALEIMSLKMLLAILPEALSWQSFNFKWINFFLKQRAKIYFDAKAIPKLSIYKTNRDLCLGMIPLFCELLFYKHFANKFQNSF
jgi:hypothetical protein